MACWWEELVPHLTRGALLMAQPQLDFLDVAHAIAADERKRVEAWLGNGQLKRAGEPDKALYEADKQLRFQFVVVQPWVLAQLLVRAEGA